MGQLLSYRLISYSAILVSSWLLSYSASYRLHINSRMYTARNFRYRYRKILNWHPYPYLTFFRHSISLGLFKMIYAKVPLPTMLFSSPLPSPLQYNSPLPMPFLSPPFSLPLPFPLDHAISTWPLPLLFLFPDQSYPRSKGLVLILALK